MASPGVLQPGQSCTETLFFTPAAVGARTGTQTISFNGLHSLPLILTGTGNTPGVIIAPAVLPEAAKGTSYATEVTVKGGKPPYTLVMAGTPSPATLLAGLTIPAKTDTDGSFVIGGTPAPALFP